MNKLTSISPLDGRYQEKTSELSPFVSEFALIKARVGIEMKYLFSLSKINVVNLSKTEKIKLLSLLKKFDLRDAEKVKQIEETTKHDVKAVELYLKRFLKEENSEMIHFGLTSEDINNLTYRIMLRSASEDVIIPILESLLSKLSLNSQVFKGVVMLGRTHGQAAVPTTLGKEFAVFAMRLSSQLKLLNKVQFTGKLNGAIGNYNALHFAYPKIDWIRFSKRFIESLGFKPNLITTQINSFEDIIEYFQTVQRINGILLDLDQDLWRYISDGWLVQKSERGQIGSSTMPQKVNPIDFENSEGNLELANGLIEVFTRKLPVSRLQRDLSNSTIIRNIGTVLGYSLLAYKGTLSGLSKIAVDREQITKGLNKDWSILTEGVQTVLRRAGEKDPYSMVAKVSKGKKIGGDEWQEWVNKLPIDGKTKEELRALTPEKYIGQAEKLTDIALEEIAKSRKTV